MSMSHPTLNLAPLDIVDGASPNRHRSFVPGKRVRDAHRRHRKNGGTASLTSYARAIRSARSGDPVENAAHLWLIAKGR